MIVNRSKRRRHRGAPTSAVYHQAHAQPVHSPPKEATHSPHARPAASDKGPHCPTLRANPYPEVTDLFCRLPLSTLFYQLEAVHLGDLLRLSVRPGVKTIPSCGFSRAVVGAPERARCPPLPAIRPHLRINQFRGDKLLRRKDNSSQGPRRRLHIQLRCREESTSRFRNINRIPFRWRPEI